METTVRCVLYKYNTVQETETWTHSVVVIHPYHSPPCQDLG